MESIEQKYFKHHNQLYKNEQGIVKGVFAEIGEEILVNFDKSSLLCKVTAKHPKGVKVKVIGHKFT